jgi:hypothetical protein
MTTGVSMARQRFLLANDTTGRWYLRRIYSVAEDLEVGHKVYRCDKHMGGPYETLFEAVHLLGKHTHAPRQRKRRPKETR